MKVVFNRIAGGVAERLIDIQKYADDNSLEIQAVEVTHEEWRDLLTTQSVFDPAASLTSAIEARAMFIGIPIIKGTK